MHVDIQPDLPWVFRPRDRCDDPIHRAAASAAQIDRAKATAMLRGPTPKLRSRSELFATASERIDTFDRR